MRLLRKCAKPLSLTLLTLALFAAPAEAQTKKAKPIGQYIVLGMLLLVPIAVVCRTSRR